MAATKEGAKDAVDALLDARRFAEALPVIESALATARLQSAWLIRRGRARLGTGEPESGRADLAAAIAELDRLRPRVERKPYEHALLLQTYGHVYARLEQYPQAIDVLQQ